MNKKHIWYAFLEIIFISVAGTFLHFAYAYSSYNPLVGFFVPINESVFEHLKLLFFPQLFFNTITYFLYGKQNKNYIFIKSVSCITGIFEIMFIHSVYTFWTDASVIWIDIIIFYLCTITTGLLPSIFLSKATFKKYDWNAYGIFFYAFVMVIFFLCTVYPPDFPIFKL